MKKLLFIFLLASTCSISASQTRIDVDAVKDQIVNLLDALHPMYGFFSDLVETMKRRQFYGVAALLFVSCSQAALIQCLSRAAEKWETAAPFILQSSSPQAYNLEAG